MINACLTSRAHYLDITGEIDGEAAPQTRGRSQAFAEREVKRSEDGIELTE